MQVVYFFLYFLPQPRHLITNTHQQHPKTGIQMLIPTCILEAEEFLPLTPIVRPILSSFCDSRTCAIVAACGIHAEGILFSITNFMT